MKPIDERMMNERTVMGLIGMSSGKAYADRTFLEAMKSEGLPFRWRWPIYMAVVVGGGGIYRNHGERVKDAN